MVSGVCHCCELFNLDWPATSRLKSLFSPSGGLSYHLRALRYRKLWIPFIEALEKELLGWRPKLENGQKREGLILIGASGGYCLSHTFLDQYSNLSIAEPDRLARRIFNKRFSRLDSRINYFEPSELFYLDGHLDNGAFDSLLAEYPDYDVLFCNLLGQLQLGTNSGAGFNENEWIKYFADLFKNLRARGFFSFHDRYSSAVAPRSVSTLSAISPLRMSPELFLSEIYAGSSDSLEVNDHGTSQFFGGFDTTYLNWWLTPTQCHCIEVVAF